MMTRKFQCSACQIVFESDSTDQEALEEFEKNFAGTEYADTPPEGMAVVCDDCYKEIMGIQ